MGNGFVVRLFEQPSVPLGEQRFAALPIRIGRSSLNDLQVSHKLVSEFHARIEEVDGKICVRDLSSKNGVFVRVPGKEQPVALAAQAPRELESHGFEFLLSPALRVQLSPAPPEEGAARRSRALGSVLGNARLLNIAADAVAVSALLAAQRGLRAHGMTARQGLPKPVVSYGFSSLPGVSAGLGRGCAGAALLFASRGSAWAALRRASL
jgi:hypothetical protein